MNLLDLVSSIPSAVWTALLAALAALAGVFLANRSNTTRMRIQLSHDSQEKAQQRLADLRRDVYLTAAEELVKANAFLGSIAQTDLAQPDLTAPIQGFIVAAAKMQLVSHSATTPLVADLVATFSEALFRSLILARPMQDARTGAKIADELYRGEQKELSRIVSAMREQNESDRSDSQAFARLDRSFATARAQSDKYAEERGACQKQLVKSQLEFMKTFSPMIKEIGRKSVLVTVALRRELDLDGDLALFETQQRMQWARMDAALDAFAKSIDSLQTEVETLK
jgi:hypothetical protein